MRPYLFVAGVLVLFVAGLLIGANNPPILVGGGGTPANSIQFPENATRANIFASSGALTVAAGGSNKNVILKPTGSGCVQLFADSPAITLCDSSGQITIASGGTNQNLVLTPSGTGTVIAGSTETGTWPVVAGFAWIQNSALSATSGNQALLQSSSGGTQVNAATGQTVTLAINGTTKATVNATGLGVLGTPSFPLDVTGDVNSSTGYTIGGAAPSNHVLIGNGTQYVDGTVPAASYNGHTLFTGTPSINSCGTGSPSVAGVDNAFTVTVGGGVVTSCSINFGSSFTNPPSCTVVANTTAATMDIVSVGTSTVTFGAGSTVGGGKLYANCF